MRFSFLLLALCALGGSAFAAPPRPWFSGYLDSNNNYKYYAFTDWDTPLFGGGIQPDSGVFGATPPTYRVDGHVIFEADGTGYCKVIESTGSCATASGLTLGSIQPTSFQFANWFSSPGFPPVSDTRGDHDANFLNIVSGLVPEPGSLALVAFAGFAMIARRR